jgi:hypothetical protein
MNHRALLGHCDQIRIARINVTIASNNTQPALAGANFTAGGAEQTRAHLGKPGTEIGNLGVIARRSAQDRQSTAAAHGRGQGYA